jgi:glucose-6-phosphate 1-dehydrogenase
MNNIETKAKGLITGEPPESCIVVIFGAAGDLAHKELIPSLFALYCKSLLPKNFAIIGIEIKNLTDKSYRDEIKKTVVNENKYSSKKWREFSKKLFYIKGDFNKDDSYKKLETKIAERKKEDNIADNILFHLATSPLFYGKIIKNIYKASLFKSQKKGWRRVIIEKPFGWDELSARKLDKEIHQFLTEEQIFRVDHFLGKETVQNMLVFRFANPGFEPIWNRNYIDYVQITVAENIGIETRGNFYEKTGIIRDMVQNHLLQLLCMVAIEPPVNYDASSLRTSTNQVLDSICAINIKKDFVLGQYADGEIDEKKVVGYRKEKNVSKYSMTPTFAALKLYLDNWRWEGVPFYLRTGKRMQRKLNEITIKFKPTPHLMFPIDKKEEQEHNILTFRLQPDEGIIYTFTAKQPGVELKLLPVNLNFFYDVAFGIEETPSAYQWLIYDALRGDQTLFPNAEWIYKAWAIVDPVIKKWESEPWLKFPNYKAGTWGPKSADNLFEIRKR